MTTLHKFKCMDCGLHFIVCSWYKLWPNEGTTRAMRLNEATGKCYCPECGSDGNKLHWTEESGEQIFSFVPGSRPIDTTGSA